VPAPPLQNSVFSMDQREFKLFRSLVHQHAGIWLRDGKQIMLAARLSRRLCYYGLCSFATYYEYLQNLP
jgi:chemotaxis methyl-accepting protein methylase